jgi:hypothetical protein
MPPNATAESKGYSKEAIKPSSPGWRFERRAGIASRELGDGVNDFHRVSFQSHIILMNSMTSDNPT